MEEVAKGASIQDLQARLRKGSNASEVTKETPSNSKTQIPDDLVQIQAYIRWENNGKPNYSPDQQSVNFKFLLFLIECAICSKSCLTVLFSLSLSSSDQQKEFEEARKDLQRELDKGTSLDDIRRKIAKGEVKTKVAKQLEKKSYFSADRIQRKKRDLMQILSKKAAEPEVKVSTKVTLPKALSTVEHFVEAKEAEDGGLVVVKKIFELADKQIMVSGWCYCQNVFF